MKLSYAVVACAAVATTSALFSAASFAYDTVAEQDVTVGEVDKTTYSVSWTWGDMDFDWKYNKSTKKYEFKSKVKCQPNVDGSAAWNVLMSEGNLYTDANCRTEYTEMAGVGGGYLYQKAIGSGSISVLDKSTNGRVNAAAYFVPSSDYGWVTGKIASEKIGTASGIPYIPLGYNAATDSFTYTDLQGGVLPGYANDDDTTRVGFLHLVVNDSADHSNDVTAGDKIGTLYIKIEPKE